MHLQRRHFLGNAGLGFGSLALGSILRSDGFGAESLGGLDGNPHFAPKAKRVIYLLQNGAPSHVDLFDHKPMLRKMHGRQIPDEIAGGKRFSTMTGGQKARPCLSEITEFKQHGESGATVCSFLPQTAAIADKLCFIKSMHGSNSRHGGALLELHTGSDTFIRPSMGSWINYGLGSENDNLPAYVAIPDPRGTPQSSVNCWGAGFLPAAFQGTAFNAAEPINNLARPETISRTTDEATRAFLRRMNQRHLRRYPGESELAARIASHELAARMQMSVPEVSDISSEPPHVLRSYGADDSQNPLKAAFARNCILARRLVEQGVRFVQLFNGAYQTGGEGVSNWDGHKVLKEQYAKHGPVLDQPVAALLADMKQRGLLEQTLVVWCTEFGRMPTFQVGASGRDHNPDGFTAWLAGAGVKRGHTHGATDDFSYKAVEDVATVHDFHATILHLLGLEHERLTFYHNGLERRLTDVAGDVIEGILA